MEPVPRKAIVAVIVDPSVCGACARRLLCTVCGGRMEAYPSSLAGAGGLGHTEPTRESRELMRRPRGRGSCCHPKPGFRVAPVAEAQKARA